MCVLIIDKQKFGEVMCHQTQMPSISVILFLDPKRSVVSKSLKPTLYQNKKVQKPHKNLHFLAFKEIKTNKIQKQHFCRLSKISTNTAQYIY